MKTRKKPKPCGNCHRRRKLNWGLCKPCRAEAIGIVLRWRAIDAVENKLRTVPRVLTRTFRIEAGRVRGGE